MNVTNLPQKVCADYWNRREEATEKIGGNIYIFRKPGDRNEICVLGPNSGHITRLSYSEMMRLCPPKPRVK